MFRAKKRKFIIIKSRSFAKTRTLKGIFARFEDLPIVDKMALIAFIGYKKLGA